MIDGDLMYILQSPKEQRHKEIHKDMIKAQRAEYVKSIAVLCNLSVEIFSDEE